MTVQRYPGAEGPGPPAARMALTDAAIGKIKSMITSGELGPGDRLPNEAELARRLGLSRSSLREAVKALAVIRVLDVRPGAGTFVTSLSPRLLLDTLSFVVDFHRDDTVLQFLEVRRVIEPAATALAAVRMPDAAVQALRALLASLGDAPDVQAFVDNDAEFHRLIAVGAGNAALSSLVEGLSGSTTRARVWRGVTQEGAVARTREQHQAIVDAIAGRQPDLARDWATVHVAGVEEWLRRAL